MSSGSGEISRALGEAGEHPCRDAEGRDVGGTGGVGRAASSGVGDLGG